jgi:uncharacterized repeat protein (TIGR01451 family)
MNLFLKLVMNVGFCTKLSIRFNMGKAHILSVILLLSFTSLIAQTIPPIQWQKSLGGSKIEYDGDREPVLRIIKTSDKGYAMAGTSYSSDGDVSGNNGKHDAWIIKLNEKGALQWERNFGGNDWDWVNSIQQTSDGGFVIIGVVNSTNAPFDHRPGRFDVWIMKLSYNGDLEWQKFYGGSDWDYGQSILQTDDGGYIFCGRTESINGDVSGNHGKSDIWVVRLNPSGNIMWQKCYGGVYSEFGNCISKTNDGGYIIGGWQSQTGSDVQYENDMQSYVIKIDANGNQEWEKKYGGSHFEGINSIKQTSDGGYVFVGTSCSNDGDVTGNHVDPFGYHDSWVVKLDHAGNLTWQKCIGGSSTDEGWDVAEAIDGYYIAAFGQSNDGDLSGNHGLHDGFVAKLSLTGQLQALKMFGGTGFEIFKSILLEQDTGNIEIVSAGIAGSYDGDVIGQHGNGDIWVLKLSTRTLQYNNLAGAAFLDENANGLHDFGEAAYDNKFIYIKDNLGFYSKYKNTFSSGFNIAVDTGRYELDLHLSDTSQYRSVPIKRSVSFNGYGNTDYFEFGLVKKSLLNFAFTSLSTDATPRPARNISFNGRFGYDGSRSQIDGLIKIVKDSKLSYVSSSLPIAYILGDTIALRFNNLAPQTVASFIIDFHVLDVPIAQPGDSIKLEYNMMPLTIDSAYFNQWDSLKLAISPRVNFIKGEAFLDVNANNIWDNDEPPFFDGIVESRNGSSTVASNLNGQGFYNNEVDTGTYITRIIPAHPYYQVTTQQYVTNFTSYYNTDSFRFAVVPVPGINDLNIEIVPLNKAKPGFNILQVIFFENHGTDTISNVKIKYVKDPRTTVVDIDPIPTFVQGDTLRWDIGSSAPLTAGDIVLQLKVAAPPSVNQADTLQFQAEISPIAGDTTPLNNSYNLRQVVVNSSDPNDKAESHAGRASLAKLQAGDRLNYVIRFQNTGNDTADNVSISDTLDSKLDWSTLKMTGASHPYRLRIVNGNVLKWTFDNIMLPDSNSNEVSSHGYVSYSIRPKASISGGDILKNRAFIHFDFNSSVATNVESTIVEMFSSLPVQFISLAATVYDNEIKVDWRTGYEYKTNIYEIQRSADARNFESLGIVKSRNFQNGSVYSFIDKLPLYGDNYYRIKAIDLDGSEQYSTVVLGKMGGVGEVNTYISPNPSNGQIWLKVEGPLQGALIVEIFDHLGQKVLSKNFGNQFGHRFQTPINLQGLSNGVYLLRTTVDGKRYLNRIVRQ